MTGDDEGDRIAPDGGPDRARRLRLADPPGDVGIGRRAAERHAEQRLPDPDLEVAADHHHPERRLRTPLAGIEGARGERRGRLRVGRQRGARPAPLHVGERGGAVPVVDEAESGEAARRGDDDRLAEGRGVEAIGEPQAVAPVVAGRHRIMGDEEVVQPAGPGQADVIGGVEHARGPRAKARARARR